MQRSISVACFLLVVAASLVAHANPELVRLQADDTQWVMPGKDYSASRFSTLAQITKDNVKNLRPAWTFSTGTLRGHEGAPLVVGATMYVHTSFPNNVYALDLNGPDVGRIKWRYLPKQDPSVQAVACCDNVNRGLSYADGKIFLSQLDGLLVALDAATGREVWKAQNADPKVGATMTSAPHVMKDKVIVGVSGGSSACAVM
jgi:glucose dehydrogenase